MEFADCVLVGRIRGRNYTAARLKTWAAEVWGQHLVDIPVVQTFVRGWFALRFARADHTNWVLSSHWHFEQAPVLLKRWTSLFDPETEQIGVGPIWVRLPRLPLQYWSEDIFKRIGNALDTYMGYDKSFHQTGMMAYARILINMDTRGGLYEHITIQWRDSARRQIIDYEGIPYRCRRCHKVGHLYRDCPLLRKSQRNGTAVDTDPPQVPPPPTPQPAQPHEAQGRSQEVEAPRGVSESGEAIANTVTVSVAPPSTTEAPAQPLSPTVDSANTGSTTPLQISSPKRLRTE